MEVLGYLCAILMGGVLGLVGGGGSILTVPILVYLMGVGAELATAYSLFVVGVAATAALFDYHRRGLVHVSLGLVFAVPAFLGVYLVRRFLMPSLPGEILFLSKDSFILMVFSLIMLGASISMIRGRKDTQGDERPTLKRPFLTVFEGLVVGAATGFVGAGGGFLIVPALVVLTGLPMKMAVGTSLMIISIKSLIGFLGDLQVHPEMDWILLSKFSGLAILGIYLGTQASRKVSGAKLKPAFGWFVLVMGLGMFLKETF